MTVGVDAWCVKTASVCRHHAASGQAFTVLWQCGHTHHV